MFSKHSFIAFVLPYKSSFRFPQSSAALYRLIISVCFQRCQQPSSGFCEKFVSGRIPAEFPREISGARLLAARKIVHKPTGRNPPLQRPMKKNRYPTSAIASGSTAPRGHDQQRRQNHRQKIALFHAVFQRRLLRFAVFPLFVAQRVELTLKFSAEKHRVRPFLSRRSRFAALDFLGAVACDEMPGASSRHSGATCREISAQ